MKFLLIVTLFTIGSSGAHGGRMLMSQEGYQDMDAPIRSHGPSDFSNFAPPPTRGFSGLESQGLHGFPSSAPRGFGGPSGHGGLESSDFGPNSFPMGGEGPQGGFSGGFNVGMPQQPPVEIPSSGPHQFGAGGPSGGEESGFSSGPGPQGGSMSFDSFPEGPSGSFGGSGFPSDGPSGFPSHEEGPATMVNHQVFGGPESSSGLGHPAFGSQGGFQDAEADDQFVKEQDSKLQAQLMRDDGEDGGDGPSSSGPSFGPSEGEGAGFGDESGKFGPESGFQMHRQPRTNLGGAWVGGNMISPKGVPSPGGFMGPAGMDNGESQGVTRLDAATIGARSRQLGIRQPNPQPMSRGPRGPINSSFNKFRPMMMGFRPPPRNRPHSLPSMGQPPMGPPMGGPSMGGQPPIMMPMMSQPDFQVFKPQLHQNRPPLNFVPIHSEGPMGHHHEGAHNHHEGPASFDHHDQLMDMARPRGRMVPYHKGGQDVSNINTFISMSMPKEMGYGRRGYGMKK